VRRLSEICFVLAGLMLLPAAVLAGPYTYSISGLVGAGGSLDESDAGLGNPAWQLTFNNELAEQTYFAARVGGLHWDSGEQVAEVFGPSLYYAVLAGEYRETSQSFSGGFVEPGVFIGLGYYWMEGQDAAGQGLNDNGIGAAIGLTGDIALNQRRSWTLRIELAAHYADLDAAQLFGMAHLGVSYRF
jgi:hypothetical protein